MASWRFLKRIVAGGAGWVRRFCYGFHARDWRLARAGAPLPVRFEPIGPSWLRAGPIPARAIFGSRAPEAFWPHAHGFFVRLEKRTEIWCTKKKRAPLHDFFAGVLVRSKRPEKNPYKIPAKFWQHSVKNSCFPRGENPCILSRNTYLTPVGAQTSDWFSFT